MMGDAWSAVSAERRHFAVVGNVELVDLGSKDRMSPKVSRRMGYFHKPRR
jgi:hypothetical protein